jgi:hypothetical protein
MSRKSFKSKPGTTRFEPNLREVAICALRHQEKKIENNHVECDYLVT